MAQWEQDTTSTRAKKFWNYYFRKQNFTFFAVASCVCFRTATLVAVCPVQRYTSSIVLTGQLRARRLRPRKSITYSLDKNRLGTNSKKNDLKMACNERYVYAKRLNKVCSNAFNWF